MGGRFIVNIAKGREASSFAAINCLNAKFSKHENSKKISEQVNI